MYLVQVNNGLQYLPVWDGTKSFVTSSFSRIFHALTSGSYAPLTEFDHYEHGKDADSTFPNLLHGAKVDELTGNIGAEIHGVQLSKLNDAGKDELALFVAKHKVVG